MQDFTRISAYALRTVRWKQPQIAIVLLFCKNCIGNAASDGLGPGSSLRSSFLTFTADATDTSGLSVGLAPLTGRAAGLVETGLDVHAVTAAGALPVSLTPPSNPPTHPPTVWKERQKEKKTSSLLHQCESERVSQEDTQVQCERRRKEMTRREEME